MDKKIFIFIVVIVFLIFASGVFYWWQKGRGPQGLDSYIVVKETPEGKIVENTKKKISMKVPKGWEVNKFLSEDKDLEIRKFGPDQKTETQLIDGMVIDFYLGDNPTDLSIEKFVNSCPLFIEQKGNKEIKKSEIDCELTYEIIGNKKISRRISKVIGEGQDENGNPIFLNNARELQISFTNNKKVYNFTCTAAGTKYKEYIQECERVIKDKIKNEF